MSWKPAALGAVAVMVAGFLTGLLLRDTQTQSADEILVQSDTRAEASLTNKLDKLGGQDCEPQVVRASKRTRYIASIRAVAKVRCSASGSGADTVTGWQFANSSDLANWEADWRNYLGGRRLQGVCEGTPGQSPWVTSERDVRGHIYCDAVHNDGGSTMAWTDDRAMIAYVAESKTSYLSNLFDWWESHVRRTRSVDVDNEERRLTRVFGRYVVGGLKQCGHTRSAIADAALSCGRKRMALKNNAYVDTMAVYHFRHERHLDAFVRSYEAEFRAPARNSTEYCDEASLVSTTFQLRGRVAGRLFCFPSNGSQWLLWTTDKTKVAGLISRSDQDIRALYRAWVLLP